MNNIKNIENSIYRINTASGSGTGFYSFKHDLIITNYHVVAGNLEVSIEDQGKNRYLAKVIYVNQGKDIAFLKVADMPKLTSSIITEHNIESASRDKVIVLGYPYGMPFTITEGIVSNPKQIIQGNHFIQTDAAINPGNSGGPVVNEKGELIGIVTSKFSDADNIGFAIPTSTLIEELELVEDLIDTLSVGCHSCGGLIQEKTNYCPNCGTDINDSIFDNNPISDLSVMIEEAIAKLNIYPVLARSGNERWFFHQGSAEIRMFIYDNNYLFATSPLNDLPRKNLAELYEYILTTDTGDYRLSISDNQIFLSYRVHLSDLYSDNKDEVLEGIAQLALKADELDDMFVNDFGAKMTHYSK